MWHQQRILNRFWSIHEFSGLAAEVIQHRHVQPICASSHERLPACMTHHAERRGLVYGNEHSCDGYSKLVTATLTHAEEQKGQHYFNTKMVQNDTMAFCVARGC